MAPEPPKGVSSRLLTMKFMQRAAASASSAASPDSGGASKKRKYDHSPAQGRIDAQIDQALIQAALDDQEATRQAALEKHAAADTHWTLDKAWNEAATADAKSTPLNVVYVGYGDIDSDNESGDNEDAPAKGRTSTQVDKKPSSKARLEDAQDAAPANGRGLTVLQQRGKKRDLVDDEPGSQASPDQSDEAPRKRKHRDVSSDGDSSRSRDRSRSKSRSRQNKEGVKAKEFRDKRKKKEIRLDQITSISSGGGGGGSPSGGQGLTCYACHQTGHKSSDCPKRKGSFRRKA